MGLISDALGLARDSAGDTLRLPSQLLGQLRLRLARDPQPVFALLREVRPVFVRNGMAVVTRFPDVVEVLSHDVEFSVQGYDVPMREVTGDFILGLDQGPEYERAVSLLRLAFRQTDVPTIAGIASQAADDCVSEVAGRGTVDVVTDLTDRVPAMLSARYLGVPGPDERTLINWSKVLFNHIFVDLQRDRIQVEQALAAGAEMRAYLANLVGARASAIADGKAVPDDVLTRLLNQQALGGLAFTDTEICTNLFGIIVGMIPTMSKATALAIDELFRWPRHLDGARQAARDGDNPRFNRYVSEAMRLNPQAPGLLRRAVVDYPLARGTRHETLIRSGTVVFASTQSAMLDPSVVAHPREFRLDRPDSVYLHFGAGLHQCFGRFVNAVVIPAIIRRALSIPAAVRAPGRAGRLRIDGNWPTSMTLRFPVTAAAVPV
jgi:cytochrome P450